MTTKSVITMGAWQTLFINLGLKAWLSEQNELNCLWAETTIPTRLLQKEPVALFVGYHGYGKIDNCLRTIQRMQEDAPRVAITASSGFNREEVERFIGLGVTSLLKLPSDAVEAPSFLAALKGTAHGYSFFDPEILPSGLEVSSMVLRGRVLKAPLSAVIDLDLASRYLVAA